MSTTKFRLFETTSVVFEEIVNQMELNEIFYLSLCSRKTTNIVRCHLRKSIRYPLFFNTKQNNAMHFGFVREEMLVFMITLKVSEMKEPMNVNIGGEKKQISKYGNHILFHDAEFPWRQCVSLVFKHITYLFRMEIQILYCHNPGAMKFIRRRQSTPLWMTYAGNWLSSMYWTIENYEADKCIRTKGLCFRGWIPEDYDFSLKRDYEYVQAKRWNCRELEDVLKIARRSKEVILDESRLVSKNVNDFFNHWLENRIDGLKFLSIKMAYLSYTEALVFRGIEHRITDTTEEVNYKSFTGELYQLSPGKCLRRDDGVIALFYYDPITWILNFDVVDVVN